MSQRGVESMFEEPEGVPVAGVGAAELRQLLERAHRVEDEIREMMDLRRDFWGEVKARGFDVPALKAILREQRADQQKLSERRAMTDFYRDVLGDGPLFDAAASGSEESAVSSDRVVELPGANSERYRKVARDHGIPEEVADEVAAEDDKRERRRAAGRAATRRWREKKKAEAAQQAAE